MDTIVQNVRYAARSLFRSPGFAVVTILTLALGIGANAAIFSVINAVLLRPLPYSEPERLVTVNHAYPSQPDLRAPVSPPGYRDYAARTDLFVRAAVENGVGMNLTGQDEPERVAISRVTGDYFSTLGVVAGLGRLLRPDDARLGAHVAVLTHGFWTRKFGRDAAAVGRTLRLNGVDHVVVGVVSAAFRDPFLREPDVFVPVGFAPDELADTRRNNEYLDFVARLAPGVSLEHARAEMHLEALRLREALPYNYPVDWDLPVTPLAEAAVQRVRPALLLLWGAVVFVLLIACANVANLQLARTAFRSREIALRLALGARPRRVVGQLLTESLLLSLLGGAVGLVIAAWCIPALLALNAGALPVGDGVLLDTGVIGYLLLVSVGAGVLVGLLSALHAVRGGVPEQLREGWRGVAGERSSLRVRRGLVVTTVAMALALLTGAGLLIRSFSRLLAVDPGFRPDHLLTFSLSLPPEKYASDTARIAVIERMVTALRAGPDVASAAATSNMPFAGNWWTSRFNVEGYEPPSGTPPPWGDVRVVTPAFFATLGVTLLRGREFTDADRQGATPVTIVDEGLARRYWPNADPIGKRITRDRLSDSSITWIQVVGVVRHTLHEGLDGGHRAQYYLPLAQGSRLNMGFAVRTRGEPMAALGEVRAAVRSVDPDLPLARVNTMDALVEASAGPRRFSLLLLGCFAALAMLLASVGLYGVTSYVVARRERELGLRLALGASAADVLRMVLGQEFRLALLGVGIGLAVALALARLMRTLVYGVSNYDLMTFVAAPVLLTVVALVAIWLPARRATRVDPMVALRSE